jgi:hypothetical protein
MTHLLLTFVLFFSPWFTSVVVDFNEQSSLQNWRIVDDVVMGGRSSGTFQINSDGHAVFQGTVSLENNGGFSSVRYAGEDIMVGEHTKVVIRLKGDGKTYQFRIKARDQDYYSFILSFATTGEWQEIDIPLHDMYPSWRGRRLNMENFNGASFAEMRFLIGNKRAEDFTLLIDRIELR